MVQRQTYLEQAMNNSSNNLMGQRAGRFIVSESSEDQLVLTGRTGSAVAYIFFAVLLGAWAASLWGTVLSGNSKAFDGASALSVISLICLWVAGATMGAKLTFDGRTKTVTRSNFFGLRTKTFGKPPIAYVSIRVNPQNTASREKAFCHLMNDSQYVELYILSSRTDQLDAVAMIEIAQRIRTLLELRPRCEGLPEGRSLAFVDAYSRWAETCPDGVQPLRDRLVA